MKKQTTIMIEVNAWVHGPLALHRSVAVPGFTITHIPSGKKVLSRIMSKADALAAIEVLLNMEVDWTVPEPCPEPIRETVLQYIKTVRRSKAKMRKTKATVRRMNHDEPRTADPEPERSEQEAEVSETEFTMEDQEQ
jgi:hypothetical protein